MNGADAGACAACGATAATLVQQGVRHDPAVSVVRCDTCGLVRLRPLPSEDELGAYYSAEYRDDYGEAPVAERHISDLDEARTRVGRIGPLLSAEADVLEIGAGSGAFAVSVLPYVASATVVEPDERSRDFFADRLGVRSVDSVDSLSERERFDLVALFHVLEHVLDPVAFLARLGALLRPGGRIVCEVPNVDDALVALYAVGRYLPFYYQKAHLWYFSPATLARVFERAGLPVEIRGIQRYDLSNHLRWMLSGEPGGQAYYGDVFPPGALAAYADALVAAGHADTLWTIAGEPLSYPGPAE